MDKPASIPRAGILLICGPMRFGPALIAACLVVSGGAQTRKVSDEEVARVHRSALLIDTHNDITGRTVTGLDIGKASTQTQTDLPRLRKGGVGAVFFAAYVAATYVAENRAAHRALEMIDTIRRDIVERYPKDFVLARSASEIVSAHKQGKIAALIGIEGGHAIEDNLRLLRDFYELGVRYMTLTHSNTNNWADASGLNTRPAEVRHRGLTAFGKEVIAEMNRLGMIVDISHVADKTFWDALETSRVPIFASHSSCRALSNVRRNMTDEMIKALGKKGGVIQINIGCPFLAQNADGSKPSVADVAAHIDHVRQIAGIGAVGIGTDYDGVSCVPEGMEDVSKFPNLTRALLEKGYSAADIRKVYGENTLRLMRDVEKARGQSPISK